MSEVRTIPELLQERVGKTPDTVAYTTDNEQVTWSELQRRADGVTMALVDVGVEAGDSVAVMAQTTAEWALADLGILAAGGRSVGVYPTLTHKQVAYLLNDCRAKVAFVGSAEEAALMLQVKGDVPSLQAVIGWGSAERYGQGVQPWGEFLARGRKLDEADPDVVEGRKAKVDAEDTALLIYTSGTTGQPKGAMMSHRNCVFEVKALQKLLPTSLESDFTVSFLPMAHVAEHLVGFYSRINTGMGTHFVGSLESEKILSTVARVRPTVWGSVPRMFEKAYAKIRARVAEANPRRQAIFAWAERVGLAMAQHERSKTTPPLALKVQHALADRLVFGKIRNAFGGRVRYFVSGAAPIDVEILEFFHAAGMLVFEAYGLTECSGIATINHTTDYRFGTVGKPIPGVELRLADDGEILIRGPNVFQGYLNLPEETREAIGADGWLRTGDIGQLDSEGYLRITDRKKNLIITAGGKNVAPAHIEAQLTSDPIMGPTLIIGDQKPYLTALVTLDLEESRAAAGAPAAGVAELAQHPEIVRRVREVVRRANGELARYEQIRKVRILDRELVVGEEITPTLKLRRKILSERCRGEIASLYDGSDARVLAIEEAAKGSPAAASANAGAVVTD